MFIFPSMHISKTRLRDCTAIIVLKALIDLSAYYILAENFQPYTLHLDFNGYKLIESYFLTLAVVAVMPTDSSRISTIGIWLLVLLSHLPLLTVFAMSDFSREWSYACTFFWIAVCVILKFLPRFSEILVIKNRERILNWLIGILYVSSTLLVLLLLKNSGYAINFNLNSVYDARELYAETSTSLDRYLLNAAAFVINPVLFAFGLIRRNKIFLALAIFSQIVLFSVSGFKIALFSLPLVYFLYFSYEKNILKLGYLANSLNFLICLSFVSFFIFGDVWISALFTNRLLILPAVISYYHFDFFSNHEPIYLAQSILSSMIRNSYSELSHYIISDIYFSDPLSMANTGMLGDMYMNFRIPGLIGLALFFSFLLNFADSLSYKKDIRLVVAVFCMPILFLVNGAFLGVFLTGGMFFSFILVYLLPMKNEV